MNPQSYAHLASAMLQASTKSTAICRVGSAGPSSSHAVRVRDMATWDDEVRERFNMVAGGMLSIAEALHSLIVISYEDDDITLLVNTRDWLRDRANVFSPPGEPEQGYNSDNVVSLDAYREWQKVK